MCHHHHGYWLLLADPRDQRRDRNLVRQVEAVERLVEQQQRGPLDECLCDQQPLLLAAGQLADRAVRVLGRANHLDGLGDTLARSSLPPGAARAEAGQRHAPAVPVEPEPDDFGAPDPHAIVEAAPLRQITDAVVGPSRAAAKHADGATRGRHKAEQDLHERGLSRAIGP